MVHMKVSLVIPGSLTKHCREQKKNETEPLVSAFNEKIVQNCFGAQWPRKFSIILRFQDTAYYKIHCLVRLD